MAFSLIFKTSPTVNFPLYLPSICALAQVTSPSIIPLGPIITLESQVKFPKIDPSTRISLAELTFPSITVPTASVLKAFGEGIAEILDFSSVLFF